MGAPGAKRSHDTVAAMHRSVRLVKRAIDVVGAMAGLALTAPLAWWATWNGLVAYVLMGILFAVEWTVRRRRFHRG